MLSRPMARMAGRQPGLPTPVMNDAPAIPSYRLCVAPMLDRTDRHCRALFRRLSPHALLYSEMITTAALLHGDAERHLAFDASEHPVALQLGGSDPDDLARCALLAERRGYDEVNLNCGCPSDRVQAGRFGACLMKEPQLVADCVAAMSDAVQIPVTVKCRIGVDDQDDYGALAALVARVAGAGCTRFAVHARKAWLRGLNPRQNREIPPLRHEIVQRLKGDFPQLKIIINGGLQTLDDIRAQFAQGVDGVMLGRAAYTNPALLAAADRQLFGGTAATWETLHGELRAGLLAGLARGTPLHRMTRHLLGLHQGRPGARAFRRHLSEHAPRAGAGIQVWDEAISRLQTPPPTSSPSGSKGDDRAHSHFFQ